PRLVAGSTVLLRLDEAKDGFRTKQHWGRRADSEHAGNRLPADQYGFRGKDPLAGWPLREDPDAVEAVRESGHVSKAPAGAPPRAALRRPGARLHPPSFPGESSVTASPGFLERQCEVAAET